MNSAELLEALKKMESKDLPKNKKSGFKYSEEDKTYDGKSYFNNLNVFSTQGFRDYPKIKSNK